MRQTLFLISLLATAAAAQGQSLDRQVVATAGGYFEGTSGRLTSTTGEVATLTFMQSGSSLAQGFEQGDVLISSVGHAVEGTWARVWPNPTSGMVVLHTGVAACPWRLSTADGRLVLNGTTDGPEQNIDLSLLAQATYLLSVSLPDGRSATWRIQKML